MCGIAGLMIAGGAPEAELLRLASGMADRIVHRGPDDSGTWVAPGGAVAFGFRRLAIIDLSELGHQPMVSASRRYTMVFNGEVFNFLRLREELSSLGHGFRGRSDTEVILAAVEEWGVRPAVERLVGQFAIALWDQQERTLSLVRDHLGLKPLFVYSRGGLLVFGSELKSIVSVPGVETTIDPDSVAEFLRYLYVSAPNTIYQHVQKLRPGHILTVRDAANPPDSEPYWDVRAAMRAGLDDPFDGSEEEAVSLLETLVGEAVTSQLQADVPLGAFLSGGIDSSIVVAAMQRASSRPVKTFSIAFDVEKYNEADDAARVAGYLGTDHTEIMLTGEEALEVVPLLPEIFDEPHADTSQIPAYLLCKKARHEVTVALSGDGGDEVLGGYNRYAHGARLIGRAQKMPRSVRRAISAGIASVSPERIDRIHGAAAKVLPRLAGERHAGDRAHKVGRLMAQDTEAEMYRSLVSAWSDSEDLVNGAGRRADPLRAVFLGAPNGRLVDKMMLADQLTYLPDDQLAKVDRVSMAVSLEVRVPLVDHRLVEFSWRLPHRMKVRDGVGKWLLRQALYRQIPRELVDRPKMGLSVPLGVWLRGPLRPWAEELLSREALARDGLLNPDPVRREWRRLQDGRDDRALALWAALMLQAWRRRWA